MRRISLLLTIGALGLTAIALHGSIAVAETMAVEVPLVAKSGSSVSGMIHLQEVGDDTLKITGEIKGLTPGKHGFHFHDKGDCSSADGSSAGGHFNPTQTQHGGPTSNPHHAGDLGNIEADAQGVAHVKIEQKGTALHGPGSVLDRSIVVHKGADDFKSQPSGNSGDRVACGEIKAN